MTSHGLAGTVKQCLPVATDAGFSRFPWSRGGPMQDTAMGTIWVCQCCMLIHANGECGDHPHGMADYPEPWSLWTDPRDDIAMGLLREEHAEDCDPDDECDCERQSFSWSSCEGCGSNLGGERHAFAWFTVPRTREAFETHRRYARNAIALGESRRAAHHLDIMALTRRDMALTR